jgi:hypothetical protein
MSKTSAGHCTICSKPIKLVPSATERARKFGGQASDYTAIFTQHVSCALKQRAENASAAMARAREAHAAREARRVYL